ncbi:MAG: hypothetical protein ABW157_20795 [Candidatus Thiodiazotropha sp. LLP2]
MIDSDSTLSGKTKHSIPTDIFHNPPPNQNPLIGVLQADTLANIRDCLTLLGDLGLYKETQLTDSASNGVYHLMTCVNDALRFEIDYRDELEARTSLSVLQKRQDLRMRAD